MPWHKYIEGKTYDRDEVVRECEKRIASGRVKNVPNAYAWLEDIRNCLHENIVWRPFGSTSYGRSPFNWRAWQTATGEPICEEHVNPLIQ